MEVVQTGRKPLPPPVGTSNGLGGPLGNKSGLQKFGA